MSEEEGKKLFNKILAVVVSAIIVQVVVGAFFTWKMSYKNTLINEWQETAIEQNRKDIKDITAQFYIINSNIQEINKKLDK